MIETSLPPSPSETASNSRPWSGKSPPTTTSCSTRSLWGISLWMIILWFSLDNGPTGTTTTTRYHKRMLIMVDGFSTKTHHQHSTHSSRQSSILPIFGVVSPWYTRSTTTMTRNSQLAVSTLPDSEEQMIVTATSVEAESKENDKKDIQMATGIVLAGWNPDEDDSYVQEMMNIPPGFYGLFQALKKQQKQSSSSSSSLNDEIGRTTIMGLKGIPLLFKHDDPIPNVQDNLGKKVGDYFAGFFTMKDIAKAVEDDFLDAAKGSTDNRKGWKITTVSNPRGDSFEEARMRYEDVLKALEKGTVIFNAAGAHISKLAGPCLAVTDATNTPNAVNLYITAAGMKTSAPPHTDKQDVIVIQTEGRKFWRVYAPTDPKQKPLADVFARGKGDDDLPLYSLKESGTLLLEATLEPGDVLFIPGGFPHTTATPNESSDDESTTSVHLTFNIDTHVWDLDYLSARRMTLRRAGVTDTALGQSREEDNRYVGKVNELPSHLHEDMMEMLPLGFLDDQPPDGATVDAVTQELKQISLAVDPVTYSKVDESVWKETVSQLREHGRELMDIHRDMYLAALEEGRTREVEDAMTAHLDTKRKTLSPERMQRLSLFRVQRYFEKISATKDKLVEWSYSGKSAGNSDSDSSGGGGGGLPERWAFTMPVKVGDQVEADLGGAFFPAIVTKVLVGDKYDVKFFDGDQETGLARSLIKLLRPPNLATEGEEEGVDTSHMTPKQLKRWKKEQEKKTKSKDQRR